MVKKILLWRWNFVRDYLMSTMGILIRIYNGNLNKWFLIHWLGLNNIWKMNPAGKLWPWTSVYQVSKLKILWPVWKKLGGNAHFCIDGNPAYIETSPKSKCAFGCSFLYHAGTVLLWKSFSYIFFHNFLALWFYTYTTSDSFMALWFESFQ